MHFSFCFNCVVLTPEFQNPAMLLDPKCNLGIRASLKLQITSNLGYLHLSLATWGHLTAFHKLISPLVEEINLLAQL